VPIAAVPKTSSGKIERVKLGQRFLNGEFDAAHAALAAAEAAVRARPDWRCGPPPERRRVLLAALAEGARLVCGGGHAPGDALAQGCFVDLTIFDRVRHGMKIEREEIFGPVMSIIEWDDEATMLNEVNDSDYGLCANIWTNDISTGLRMADAVEVGYVWVNGHGGKRFKGAPFGGFKDSGIGREHSIEELTSYTQVKNINVRY
jgi:acyl-CoA reductase-like NAD-dependent aldehyde dehydrogenase